MFSGKYANDKVALDCKSTIWKEECNGCSNEMTCVYHLEGSATVPDMYWDITNEQKAFCDGWFTFKKKL